MMSLNKRTNSSKDNLNGNDKNKMYGSHNKPNYQLNDGHVKYRNDNYNSWKQNTDERIQGNKPPWNREPNLFPLHRNGSYRQNNIEMIKSNKSKRNQVVKNSENSDGWITVGRKNATKNPEIEDEKQRPPDIIPIQNEKPELTQEQKERKKQAIYLKKLRIKEEKKREREAAARRLMEYKRRDTKLHIISQKDVTSVNNSKSATMSSQIRKNTSINEYEPIASFSNSVTNNYEEEYPSVQVLFNNANSAQVKNGSIYRKLPSASHHKENIKRTAKIIKDLPSPKSKLSINSPENLINSMGNNNTSPTKKNVKSRDLVDVDIMDLIKVKKEVKKEKQVVNKPLTPEKTKIEKADKKGKIFEGKSKKLSTLHKNIVRQKKIRAEQFFPSSKGNISPLPKSSADNLGPPSDSGLHGTPEKESEAKEIEDKNELIFGDNDIEQKSQTLEECLEVENVQESNDNLQPLLQGDPQLLKEIKILMDPVHNRKFREYCHHVISPEIDQVLKEMIELLVMFQERTYSQDPLKAKAKRRYYCGLKEALKHMNRICCLVLAPNLKPSPGKGCVDELVEKVLNSAHERGVPVVFGLSLRKLGRICHRKVPVSCFSICNMQGAQDKFNKLMELLPEAKEQYNALTEKRKLLFSAEEELEEPDENKDGEEEEKEKDSPSHSTENVTQSLLEALKI